MDWTDVKESLQGVKNQDVPLSEATAPSVLNVAGLYQNCGFMENCCKDFVNTLIDEANKSEISAGGGGAGRIMVPGEIIFSEGDCLGASVYIIYRGKVEVLLGAGPLDGKSKVTIATLGPGAAFGEMQLLGLAKFRTATVIVSEFAQIFEITPTVFSKCIQEFPRERKLFEAIASRRFADLQEARKKKEMRRRKEAEEMGMTAPRSQPRKNDPEVIAQQKAMEARATRQREALMFKKLDGIPAVSVAARRAATATPTCGMSGNRHDWQDELMFQLEAEDPPELRNLPPMTNLCLDQQRWLHGELIKSAVAAAQAEAVNLPSTPRSGTKSPRNQSKDPRSSASTPSHRLSDHASQRPLPSYRQPTAASEVRSCGNSRPSSANPAVKEVLAAVRRTRKTQKQVIVPARPQTAPSSSKTSRRPQTAPSRRMDFSMRASVSESVPLPGREIMNVRLRCSVTGKASEESRVLQRRL